MARTAVAKKPTKRRPKVAEEGAKSVANSAADAPPAAAQGGLGFDAAVAQFVDFLAGRADSVPEPGDIARQTVVQFALSLSGSAPLTVRRKLACLSSFFGFLEDMGHIRGNPARRLPLPKVEQPVPVCLSEDEVQRLVAAARRPHQRAMVMLLVTTGLRRAELVGITLDDLDFEHEQLVVHGKGAKERVVPLSDIALAAVRDYLKRRPRTACNRLFVSREGEALNGRAVNRTLNRLLKKAGLVGRGITPHKLRHTFATELVRRGVDVRTVQELLGHADLQTTARYLHSDTRSKRAAVEQLNGLVALPPAAR